MTYEPGRGYTVGWHDRHYGKPNISPTDWGNATSDDKVYWEEYRQGYADASKKIIDEAKKVIREMGRDINKRFLTEDVDVPDPD